MTKELNFFQTEAETDSLSDNEKKGINIPDKSILCSPEDTAEDSKSWIQIDHHLRQHVKQVIEALLFASAEPLSFSKIREITDTIQPIRPREIRQILDELKQDYLGQRRAFKLEEIAQGYVLRTYEEYAPYIDQYYRQKRGEKLSHASTEVLAIIAHRQPVTRPQIDAIRGVDSSGTLMQLLERQLIEPVGKLEAPGRPTLYATTKEFLKHFGLKDLSELKNHFNSI